MDYFRAILQRDEKSERALQLTEEVIRHNAASYTAWHYRRLILFALKKDLHEELEYVKKLGAKNPKNYQLWHHRKIMVEHLHDPSQELEFTAKMLIQDSKNYHAWAHRQWILETYNLWKDELSYVSDLIKVDHRNNSAWNQRYYVISKTEKWTKEVKEREIDYAFSIIKLSPNNQSPWNYLSGVIGQDKYSEYPKVFESVRHYVDNFPTCAHALSLLASILQQLNTESSIHEAIVCLDKLIKVDEIHSKYWLYRQSLLKSK